jgi:hypothetical protein
VTLFSSFGASNAVDAAGILTTGAQPDPMGHGLRIGFHAFAPVADYVRIDAVDSIGYALSTKDDWSTTPGLAVYMSLFADTGGIPGAQLAGAYVSWPVTSTPTLFFASSGFPFSLPLSTSSYYWFTLSIRNQLDGSFEPTRYMTWHYAQGTTTPGLRLLGSPIPEPGPSLLLAAGVTAGLLRRGAARRLRPRRVETDSEAA